MVFHSCSGRINYYYFAPNKIYCTAFEYSDLEMQFTQPATDNRTGQLCFELSLGRGGRSSLKNFPASAADQLEFSSVTSFLGAASVRRFTIATVWKIVNSSDKTARAFAIPRWAFFSSSFQFFISNRERTEFAYTLGELLFVEIKIPGDYESVW